MFIANFYIGYMVAIFVFFYYILYYFFCKKRPEGWKLSAELGDWFNIAASTAVAICIAAIMILPIYYSLSLGKFTFTKPDMSFKLQFSVFDSFTKLLPSSYDTVRNEGLPAIYSGVITLILVPLYYLNSKINIREKIVNSVLLVILYASMIIKPLDIAWHGFQIPNWLPNRYSFLVTFVLVLMAASALNNLSGISSSYVTGIFMALAGVLFFMDTLKYEHISTLSSIWLAVGVAALLSVFIIMMKKKPEALIYPIMIMVVMFGETLISTVNTFEAINKDVVYSNRMTYYPRIDPVNEVYDEIVARDNSLYRTEKTWQRTTNDALAIGNRGITHSSSTMNTPVIKFIEKLGLCSRGHYTRYCGATPISDTILGIKYVIDKDSSAVELSTGSVMVEYGKKVNNFYNLVSKKDSEYDSKAVTYTVFENPYYAGIAYMASEKALSVDLESKDPFVNQNKLFSSIVGTDNKYFNKLDIIDTRYNNITRADAVNQVKYSVAQAGADSYIEYIVQCQTDDDVYLYFPTYYEKQINIWVNSEYDEATGQWKTDNFSNLHTFVDKYYETEYYVILKLDMKVKPGQVIAVRASILNEYTYMCDQLFYQLDQELFAQDAAKLQQQSFNVTTYNDTYIKGTVTAQDNQFLMTSIPYEGGWTIKVDGKRVDPVKVADTLIGIEMGPGEHTVVMSFFPQGLAVGIVLFILGVLVTVLFYCTDNKIKIAFLAGTKKTESAKATK